MKDKLSLKSIVNIIIVGFVILIAGIHILQILGCISFSSIYMKPEFFAYVIFFFLVFIYENNEMGKRTKLYLCGILCGTILFVYEAFLPFLLTFVINIIWNEVEITRKCKIVFGDVSKLFFYSMLTLEIYSICALCNEYLYDTLMEKKQIFKIVDVLFLISLIGYFLSDKKEENADVDNANPLPKIRIKRYVEMTRLSIWSVLVLGLVFVAFGKVYAVETDSANVLMFYLGETLDGGFLLCQDGTSDILYYTRKVDGFLGGILDNPASFQWTLLETGYTIQKILLYSVKCVYQFLYGVWGVVGTALLVVYVLIHKMLKRIMVGKRNVRNNS